MPLNAQRHKEIRQVQVVRLRFEEHLSSSSKIFSETMLRLLQEQLLLRQHLQDQDLHRRQTLPLQSRQSLQIRYLDWISLAPKPLPPIDPRAQHQHQAFNQDQI